MPGLLDERSLENVYKAWQRALRLHPLLSRVTLPELRPFAAAFNLALSGEDDDGTLAERCDDLGANALDPDAIIEITTELAASFTDELGTTSGAQIKSIVATQGHVCALLTAKMVRDERDVAHRDSLTALENRVAFIAALMRDARAQRTITLVALDLDGLKAVNDGSEEGHVAGDRYMRTFASQLALALPDAATPYRVGGDEFAIRWLDQTEPGAIAALESFRDEEIAPFSFGVASGLVEMAPDHEESDLAAGADLYSLADEREREMKAERKAATATGAVNTGSADTAPAAAPGPGEDVGVETDEVPIGADAVAAQGDVGVEQPQTPIDSPPPSGDD